MEILMLKKKICYNPLNRFWCLLQMFLDLPAVFSGSVFSFPHKQHARVIMLI